MARVAQRRTESRTEASTVAEESGDGVLIQGGPIVADTYHQVESRLNALVESYNGGADR